MKKLNFAVMLFLTVISFLSCKEDIDSTNSAKEDKITTSFSDTIASPIYITGYVASSDSIIERGFLYGITDTLTISNSTLVENVNYGISSGGFFPTSTINGKIVNGKGSGSFNSTILYLLNGYAYSAKSYAITITGKILYGNLIQIKSRTYVRDHRRFDYANVFWNNSCNLFDLLTDEVILPDTNGNYNFWYSSNENPIVNQISKTSSTLSAFLFYKFKNRANCQRWCDIKTGKIK
jgi:hypothetical protein